MTTALIERFRSRLPVTEQTPVISLGEGSTPLLPARRLSELLGTEILLKWEASNPTGSYKDRGMTVAVSKAAEDGAEAVICASTGNTAASAAAYAARAGIPAVVLTPAGAVAGPKVAQTRMAAKTYRLLVVDNKSIAERFPVEQGKFTVLFLNERGVITDIRFAAPGQELRELLINKTATSG